MGMEVQCQDCNRIVNALFSSIRVIYGEYKQLCDRCIERRRKNGTLDEESIDEPDERYNEAYLREK